MSTTRIVAKPKHTCGTTMLLGPSGWTCPNCPQSRIQWATSAEREAFDKEWREPKPLVVGEECPACDGTGSAECTECDGEGVVKCPPYGHKTCRKCDGNGFVKCKECNGEGIVTEKMARKCLAELERAIGEATC